MQSSNVVYRKLPRIIARPMQPKMDVNFDEEELIEEIIPRDEVLAQELRNDDVEVRNGVMVTLNERPARPLHPPVPLKRSIIIVDGSQPDTSVPYKETALPGVADEVESYPCKYCTQHDRIFLTPQGLEKHTLDEHPQHFETVLAEIALIQSEWAKREEDREKHRERINNAKFRQSYLAQQAVEQRTLGVFNYGGNEDEPEQYNSCPTCNMLINSQIPQAMESHQRAHKKNDELKYALLEVYGNEIVMQLTCHDCHLVFPDTKKLQQHNEANHVRRRKYVCKWCGFVALSVSGLNIHKEDIHAMTASNRPSNSLTWIQRKYGARTGVLGSCIPRAARHLSYSRQKQACQDMPCLTTCEMCDLLFVRPSLLVRHMSRVHNKSEFNSEWKTEGTPNFFVRVTSKRIEWTCCGMTYTDRRQFYLHRRIHLEDLRDREIMKRRRAEERRRASILGERRERQIYTTTEGPPANYVLVNDDDDEHLGDHLISDADGNMVAVHPDGVDMGMTYVFLDENETIGEDGQILQYQLMEAIDDEQEDEELLEEQDDMGEMGEPEELEELEEPPPPPIITSKPGTVTLVVNSADGTGTQTVEISEEQYEQLKAQCGENLEGLQVMFENIDPLDDEGPLMEDDLNDQMHMQSNQMHMQSNQMHMQSSQMHMQSNQMHMQSNQMHMQSSQMHMQAEQMHMQDDQLHMQSNQMHMQDEQMHMQDEQLHMQSNQMHMPDEPMHMQTSQMDLQDEDDFLYTDHTTGY